LITYSSAHHQASTPAAIAGQDIASSMTTTSTQKELVIESVKKVNILDGHSLQAVTMQTLFPQAKFPQWRLAPDERPAWREKRIERATACADSGCIAFVHATWERDKTLSVRHVYYAYAIGGWITDSRFALRP